MGCGGSLVKQFRWLGISMILSGTVFPQAKRLVTFEDLTAISRIEQLRLSPDGETLLYTIEEKPDLFIVGTKAGSSPHSIGEGTVPRWSPDSRRIAYYSRKSGTLQLWTFDINISRTKQVTDIEGGIKPDHLTCCIGLEWHEAENYSWSPDGTRLVFHSQTYIPRTSAVRVSKNVIPDPSNAVKGEPLILTNHTAPEWTLSDVFRAGGFLDPRLYQGQNEPLPTQDPTTVKVDELYTADVTSGVVSRLTNDDLGYFNPEWSPDGKEILCISNEGRELTGWGAGPTNLYSVDAASGKARALTSDSVYKDDAVWSPDGRWISYFGAAKPRLASVYVFVMPSSGGPSVNVTEHLDRKAFAPLYWMPKSDSIILNYVNGVDRPIGRLDIRTGEVNRVHDSSIAWRQSLTVSRSGTIAWNQKDPTCPSCIYVVPSGSTSPYLLLNLNPQIKELKLGVQEVIRWKNGRGDQMEGVLLKPADYDNTKSYPLVVDVYPKQPNGFKGSPMVPAQAWASRGYAVLFPNGDAPNAWENPWKSMRSMASARGVAGIEIAVDDVTSGVNEVVRLGIADSHRVCLYGFSNGGAVVNQVITRTNRFVCAISVAAALSADWSSDFFLYTSGKSVTEIAGASPWEDPHAYYELSAVQHLDKVSTPLLLADGDNDGPALVGNIEMYNGLRWLGKDVTLLRYPGQGHGFTGPAMRDFWERENKFLDSYLHPIQ